MWKSPLSQMMANLSKLTTLHNSPHVFRCYNLCIRVHFRLNLFIFIPGQSNVCLLGCSDPVQTHHSLRQRDSLGLMDGAAEASHQGELTTHHLLTRRQKSSFSPTDVHRTVIWDLLSIAIPRLQNLSSSSVIELDLEISREIVYSEIHNSSAPGKVLLR